MAFAVSLTRAAEIDFRPVLNFGIFYEGNVAIIGDTSNGQDAAAVSVELPVERKTPHSQLSFKYQPSYVAYRQDSSLDYFGQQALITYAVAPSRSSSYSFDLDAVRTDRQGIRSTAPDRPVTFVPRSTQTNFAGSIRGDHTGRRNLIGWELRASLDDYAAPDTTGTTTDVPCLVSADCDDGNACTIDSCFVGVCQHGLDTSNPNCTLQNSLGVGARVSWRYAVSERSSIGLGLDAQMFSYDTLPSAYVESLGLVGAHTFSRFMTMTYMLGGAYAASGDDSDTEPVGDVTLSRNVSEVSTLSAGARRWISQGSGIGGISLDQGAYVAYGYNPHRPGPSGSVTAGYWKRDPVPVAASANTVSTETISANASFGWYFSQYLSLNAAYTYSDQTSSLDALNTQYGSYGVYLRWSIRGDVHHEAREPKEGQQQAPQGGETPTP